MCQLVESIKIKDGKTVHIEYHQKRMNRSRNLYFNLQDELDIAGAVNEKLQEPDLKKRTEHSLCKCRVVYGKLIDAIAISEYHRRCVQSLKLVYSETINYNFKYADRSALNELFDRRGECDDILIVKDGKITDTSYSNVAFYDGNDWYTPSTYLLPGTKRSYLLETNIIKERIIQVSDIKQFEKLRIINAMIDFEDEVEIAVNSIVF